MAVVTETDQTWGVTGTPRGAGWLAFASTMLFISGGMKIFDGLWAFKYDDDVSTNPCRPLCSRATSRHGAGCGSSPASC